MPTDSGHSQELKSVNVPVTALTASRDPLSKGTNPSAQTVLGHLPQHWAWMWLHALLSENVKS